MGACLRRAAVMQDAQDHNPDCIGVVLAGGRSRRMGRDKALLECGGITLLRHQVDCLAQVCAHVVVSGEYPGFDCVPDARRDGGPLSGMHAAATRFPGGALLFLAIDMPAMTPQALRRLRLSGAPSHYRAQPLPCHMPDAMRLADAIGTLWAGGGKPSVQALHRVLASQVLPVADAALFENLNTPAQWQAFRAGGSSAIDI